MEREISPREAARAYGRAGIAVLPLHYIKAGRCSCGKACATPGKHPWTRNGVHDATTDDRKICAWWDVDPNLNVGIAPGERNGFLWLALDVDRGPRERKGQAVELDGEAELRALEREFGEDVPRTVEQESGSGARHVILRVPIGSRLPGKLSRSIDVIGPGKYIVAAPSNHVSGGKYRWMNPNFFDRAAYVFDRAPIAPKWLIDFDPERRPRRGAEGNNDLRKLAKKTDLSEEEFERAVMSIPNSGLGVEYDEYMNVLFAIHFETDGTGRELAHKWASQSDKYEPDYTDKKWDSIYDEKGESKTGKYILMRAKEHGWESEPKIDWQIAIKRINKDHAIVKLGADIRVLKETWVEGHITKVVFMKPSTFELDFLPETYLYPSPTDANPNRLKPVSIGTIWLRSKKRRSYDSLIFEPNLKRARPQDYNLYRGFAIAPARVADPYRACKLLVDHVYDIIAGGNEEWGDWIIAWLAQQLQRPWLKLGTALVIRGNEGAGKSVLGKAMAAILGAHHIVAEKPNDILGNFNVSLATAMFAQMEEAFWAGDKRAEGSLKHLITGETIRMEPKGVDATQIRNYSRIMITTNEPWAVPAGLAARRFGVFHVTEDRLQDRAYFGRIDAQMEAGGNEAFLQYLMETDLSKMPDPAVIPKTGALLEQKLATLRIDQRFVVELISPENDRADDIWKTEDSRGDVEVADLIRFGEQAYKATGARWPGNALFIVRMKDLLPLQLYQPHSGKRRYDLPSKAECRAIVETKFGQKLFD